MEEKFKRITFKEGFEHIEINNLGTILRNADTGYIYKNTVDSLYIRNELKSPTTGERWRPYRHQLVYFQFHPEADYFDPNYGKTTKGSLVINHIDEIKTNNKLENLELIVMGDNIRYSNNVPIFSIDKQGNVLFYDSITQARDKLKLPCYSNIGHSLKTKGVTAYDRFWFYAKDFSKELLQEMENWWEN